MEVTMKKLFLLLSLLLSSNQLLVSAEQGAQQEQLSSSEKKPSCLICGKVFSKKSNLNRHMQKHQIVNVSKTDNKLKGLKCQYCQETFTVLPSKYKHIQRRHPGVTLPDYKYQCPCAKKFRLEDEVVGHKARSTDERCHTGNYIILSNEPAQLTQEQALTIQQQVLAEEAIRREEIERIARELKSIAAEINTNPTETTGSDLSQQQALAEATIREKEIQRIARELQVLAEETTKEEEIKRIAKELQEAFQQGNYN